MGCELNEVGKSDGLNAHWRLSPCCRWRAESSATVHTKSSRASLNRNGKKW
jgi:hypothetical protein